MIVLSEMCVGLCTKARSKLETPALLVINLRKSDSSNIILFRAEARGTLANTHADNFSPSCSVYCNDINHLKL